MSLAYFKMSKKTSPTLEGELVYCRWHFKINKKTSSTLEGEWCYCSSRLHNLSLVSSVPRLRGAVTGAGQEQVKVSLYDLSFIANLEIYLLKEAAPTAGEYAWGIFADCNF